MKIEKKPSEFSEGFSFKSKVLNQKLMFGEANRFEHFANGTVHTDHHRTSDDAVSDRQFFDTVDT